MRYERQLSIFLACVYMPCDIRIISWMSNDGRVIGSLILNKLASDKAHLTRDPDYSSTSGSGDTSIPMSTKVHRTPRYYPFQRKKSISDPS